MSPLRQDSERDDLPRRTRSPTSLGWMGHTGRILAIATGYSW